MILLLSREILESEPIHEPQYQITHDSCLWGMQGRRILSNINRSGVIYIYIKRYWPSGSGLLYKATETQKSTIETNRNYASAQTRSPQGNHKTTQTSTNTTQICARKTQNKANLRNGTQNNANLHKRTKKTNKEHRKSTNKQGTPIKQITVTPRYRADLSLKHVNTT